MAPTTPTITPPPLLHVLENVSQPAALQRLRAFYGPGGAAATFRVHSDDACGLPADWRSTWAKPRQWGLTGEKNWATKYAAAGFIPRMIERSPFVTADWRQASASVVVLFARQYAGGPAILQQQCLQRLQTRSEAFRATNGSRHFFIFTDSRGPCCLDGKYKDVDFLNHHVIGPHAEPPPQQLGSWFFRSGEGPPIACYDARKDIGIPTPNIHFPRTPFAPSLPEMAGGVNSSSGGGGGGGDGVAVGGVGGVGVHGGSVSSDERPLLLFYAGWSYGCRMTLVRLYRDDPELLVRRSVKVAEYKLQMQRAKFCPICGGYSQVRATDEATDER